jgi:hypothetical protein
MGIPSNFKYASGTRKKQAATSLYEEKTIQSSPDENNKKLYLSLTRTYSKLLLFSHT